MKRFSLIARLGVKDVSNVSIQQSDSLTYELNFIDSNDRLMFGLGHALEQLSTFGLTAPEEAIDLTLLAAMVNAADTRISRATNAQGGWTREIDLYLPVYNPSIWWEQSNTIQRMLGFLSGDRWRVFFRPRDGASQLLCPTTDKLPLDGFTEVSLLSGGLDSLIGAINSIKEGEKPLFVSHYWDAETAKSQSFLLNKLQQRYGDDTFKSIRVRLGFDKASLDTGQAEDTQRGRSFLFYALATLAASSFQQLMPVNVPENGLIALNVPLDPLRFGALSTRTAHPHFMASMQKLIKSLNLKAELNNPYRHQTKGEMVNNCADIAFLREIAASSMSCSSPAKTRYKGLPPMHCGYCVPCLIRRASLHAGLGIPDRTKYFISNLKAQTVRSDRAEGEHIRSFQLMLERLSQEPSLTKYLIHKPGPLIDAPAEIPAYEAVFTRGMNEVANILTGVLTKPG